MGKRTSQVTEGKSSRSFFHPLRFLGSIENPLGALSPYAYVPKASDTKGEAADVERKG
jgi:hypothetical protein